LSVATALLLAFGSRAAAADTATPLPSPSATSVGGAAQSKPEFRSEASEKSHARVGWGRSATQFGLVFGAGMAVAALIFFLIYGARSYRRRTEQEVRSKDLFLENAVRLGLTTEERSKLSDLLSHQKVLEPHTIFQSLPLFEQAIDAEVDRMLGEGVPAGVDGPEERLLTGIRKRLGFSHLPLEHPLVSTRNIAVGQAGSVFTKEDNKPLFHKATVVANNSFFFTIQYDPEKEEPHRLGPGDVIRFAFARQNDGLYGAQVKVKGAEEAGSIDLLHTTDLRRNQLRQYLRVETNLTLRFRLLSTKDPEKSEIQRGHLITSKMADISGGGLSFLYEQSLRLGDLVALSFELPGQVFSGITGKIVHLTLLEGKSAQVFKHHIQFVNIDQRKREGIIKYVFDKERQNGQFR